MRLSNRGSHRPESPEVRDHHVCGLLLSLMISGGVSQGVSSLLDRRRVLRDGNAGVFPHWRDATRERTRWPRGRHEAVYNPDCQSPSCPPTISLRHMTHNPQRAGLHTEADVDARIVLPTLLALGITPGNVRAQRTFTVRLGRSEIVVGSEVRRGRADYLITNDANDPLFILELKGPDELLTDDDRDQAISYARLLHPIAPLAVLSNGKEWRIFDTVTKAPIVRLDDGTRWPGAVLGDDDALRLRSEALEHFVGYAPENVSAFSRVHVRAGMAGLRGDGRLARKFEPSLYVRRPRVRALFAQFLQQIRFPVFALGGPSGVGKTNEMCALAEACAEEHVTLFLHGPDLAAPLATVLTDAFAWHFAEALPLRQLCRRLDALARRSKTPVLLFIDAVDEAASPFVVQELSELATQLTTLGCSIRLILSAKTLEWRRLLRVRDVETPLARAIFIPDGAPSPSADARTVIREAERVLRGVRADEDGPRVSATLEPFDTDEAMAAHARYGEAFDLDPAVFRRYGNDPFLLRITAEVARDARLRSHGLRVDLAVDERALVRGFVNAKLARMADPERARRELRELATALAKSPAPHLADGARVRREGPADNQAGASTEVGSAPSNFTGEFEATGTLAVPPVAATRVRDAARITVAEPFADELVAFGVLIRLRDAEGDPYFAFAYDRIRDYSVATYGFAFPTARTSALHEVFAMCMQTAVGRAAFVWYLPYFTADQWKSVEEFVADRAEASLAVYERLRAHILPPARTAMDRAALYDLGVVYSVTPNGQFSLGYFPRWRAELPRVKRERDPRAAWGQAAERAQRGIHPSIERIRRAPWYLADPTGAAVEHTTDQLARLVREGHLLTLDSYLRLEQVVALTIANSNELHVRRASGDDTFSRLADHNLGTAIFPLDVRDLRARVQWALALRWHQSIHGDPERAAAEARREIAAGRDFAETLVGDGELRALARMLELLPNGIHEVPSALLPGPDLPCDTPGDGWRSFERYYSDAQLTAFLHSVFGRALDAVRRILDVAFDPALRALIGSGPTMLAVEARRIVDDNPHAFGANRLDLRLTILSDSRSGTGDQDAVTVRLIDGAEWEVGRSWDTVLCRYDHTAHALRRHEFGLSMLFMPHRSPPIVPGDTSWGGANLFAPVRSIAHLLLTDALAACDTALIEQLAQADAASSSDESR